MELCEGRVTGTTAKARSKRTPSAARPSILGVYLLVSIAANVVGAQRVNRNQDHVGRRFCWRSRGCMKGAEERQDENESKKNGHHR